MQPDNNQAPASSQEYARPLTDPRSGPGSTSSLIALVLAGEVIYTLPYFLRRDYAPAMMKSMDLSQSELGYMSSLFGFLALLCYGPSGLLADRFGSRKLLSIAPLATGLVGLLLVFFPSFSWLLLIFALLGISSILPFWAALIKATRLWGARGRQGLAFGLLDGGRGLVAAILASSSVLWFELGATPAEGLRNVILYYCTACVLSAAVAWFFIPQHWAPSFNDTSSLDPSSNEKHEKLSEEPQREPSDKEASEEPRQELSEEASVEPRQEPPRYEVPSVEPRQAEKLSEEARQIPAGAPSIKISTRRVALLSLVLFFAYASYWGTFYFSSYAVDGYQLDDAQAARITSSIEWLRPPLAVLAGLLADRIGARISCVGGFFVASLGYASLFLVSPSGGQVALFIVQAVFVSAAVFVLRGVFYALLQEVRVPLLVTGLVVGTISVVGYSPDVLVPPVAGHLLDAIPGSAGYQLWFGILAALSGCGAIVSLQLRAKTAAPSST